jgi:hypothetical protein
VSDFHAVDLLKGGVGKCGWLVVPVPLVCVLDGESLKLSLCVCAQDGGWLSRMGVNLIVSSTYGVPIGVHWIQGDSEVILEERREGLGGGVVLPDTLLLGGREKRVWVYLRVLALILMQESLVMVWVTLFHVVLGLDHWLPVHLKEGVLGREDVWDTGGWCGASGCVTKDGSCLKVMGEDDGRLP